MISRTLMHRVAEKNEGEAELRYELTRVRESAETIALLAGDADEEKRLGVTSTPCCSDGSTSQFSRRGSPGSSTEIQLSRRSFRCFSAPRNSLRERCELMQLASAFLQVQVALNWLVDNSIRLAEWNASARRVGALASVLNSFDGRIVGERGTTIVLGDSPDEICTFRIFPSRRQTWISSSTSRSRHRARREGVDQR